MPRLLQLQEVLISECIISARRSSFLLGSTPTQFLLWWLTLVFLSYRLKVCKEVGGADVAVNYRDKDWQQQVKGKQ